MSAKKGAAKWDDDDDIPLALRVKQAAKPAPQASAPAKSAPASAKKAEDTSGAASPSAADAKKKKDKELRQRIKAKADPIPVLRAANKSAGGGSGPLEWAQKNWKTIAIVVGCLLFFYFKEDPFKVLGLPSSASDADVKRVYRELSLQLHPDKNPGQSQEDAERFTRINQAYKTLSDPEKRAKWQSGENPEESGIPSDTQSLTDMNAESYIGAEHAALVLAYSDYSSECWEMADEWEAVGKDLGRYVNVVRFNMDKEPGLARKFATVSVPMIYSVVGGKRTTFYGEPTHANVTLFVTKSLAESVTVIQDDNGGAFLEDADMKPKVMLFAELGMVKLRMAYRAFAWKHRGAMDAAEVTVEGAGALRAAFNVSREPALAFVKEAGSRPLLYTNKMSHGKLNELFQQHKHHAAPRLTALNYRDLCGAGALGGQPCVLYLHDSAAESAGALAAARAVLRNASQADAVEAAAAPQARAPTAFAWVDLAVQPGVRAALVAAKGHKLAWSHTHRARGEGDFDPVAGSLAFAREAPYVNYRNEIRQLAPQLMSVVVVIALYLLWFACTTLYRDSQESRKRSKFRKQLEASRRNLIEKESTKLSKFQEQEARAREAAERKRREAEEEARRREDNKARQDALARAAAAQAAAQAAAAAAAAKPKPVSDAELREGIRAIVAAGDLDSLTKRVVRESLQAKFPKVDLFERKTVVEAEIVAAVTARVEAAAAQA